MMRACWKRGCDDKVRGGCCSAARKRTHIALLARRDRLRYLCGGEIAGMHLSIEAFREAGGATGEHADGVVDYAMKRRV
jgi:hypothetical protein